MMHFSWLCIEIYNSQYNIYLMKYQRNMFLKFKVYVPKRCEITVVLFLWSKIIYQILKQFYIVIHEKNFFIKMKANFRTAFENFF